jgi:hypothetical protein
MSDNTNLISQILNEKVNNPLHFLKEETAKPLALGTTVEIIAGNKQYVGEKGKITKLVGDVFPYGYQIALNDGRQLVYLGNEVKSILKEDSKSESKSLKEILKEQFGLSDDDFTTYQTDLQILPGDKFREVIDFLKNHNIGYSVKTSDVKGQSWHGKRFVDVFFGAKMKLSEKPKSLNESSQPENEKFVRAYGTGSQIGADGKIDVKGDVGRVILRSFVKDGKLTIGFNSVFGDFDCSNLDLRSLEGCPSEVDGDFDCYANFLTTLDGCPLKISGDVDCSHNLLKNLKGSPKLIRYNFYCQHNLLISLDGIPEKIDGSFLCHGNTKRFTDEDVKRVCVVKGSIST